jgi:hypothetical protein
VTLERIEDHLRPIVDINQSQLAGSKIPPDRDLEAITPRVPVARPPEFVGYHPVDFPSPQVARSVVRRKSHLELHKRLCHLLLLHEAEWVLR